MAKLQAGDTLDLVALSKTSSPIGDVKQSMLTLAQFQAENLGTWMLMDGASCVGTLYATITGKAVVPDMVTSATFVRQAAGARVIGSYEADAFQGHFHQHSTGNNTVAGGNYTVGTNAYGSSGNMVKQPIADGANGTPRTANETRPKNIALNFFIKVGY
jgi:hypothetical protein